MPKVGSLSKMNTRFLCRFFSGEKENYEENISLTSVPFQKTTKDVLIQSPIVMF